MSQMSNMSNNDETSMSSFKIKIQPTIEEFDQDSRADVSTFNKFDLMRKQSDPQQLQSRLDYFSNLKLLMPGPNFSAGNASDEPHSAASFSAKGIECSPETAATNNLPFYNNNFFEQSNDILTPTLPGV